MDFDFKNWCEKKYLNQGNIADIKNIGWTKSSAGTKQETNIAPHTKVHLAKPPNMLKFKVLNMILKSFFIFG